LVEVFLRGVETSTDLRHPAGGEKLGLHMAFEIADGLPEVRGGLSLGEERGRLSHHAAEDPLLDRRDVDVELRTAFLANEVFLAAGEQPHDLTLPRLK
jgi:hypothetical protein